MKEDLNIVTEVGIFGNLNIEDPTITKIKKKNADLSEEELNKLIQESVRANANIWFKKSK